MLTCNCEFTAALIGFLLNVCLDLIVTGFVLFVACVHL